ncbi:hypothetical protein BVC80_1835g262 [Macleaya cordata]|uniref:DUF7054 domain-containing protein n=1 Tax=Macleaya cordata TaxID=56857 RepID=A0A200R583_MACCD|nr:hypothetical protein BVC80_1835g262 [Macleaya cordata]
MPTSRNHRFKGQQLENKVNRMGKLPERSASFHGKSLLANQGILRRPKTDPDLLSGTRKHNGGGGGILSSSSSSSPAAANDQILHPQLTKLLLNVTVQRSLGPIHVVMSLESTVGDLIAAVVRQYAKEGRRPSLRTTDPSDFNLHYSQFSLESLDREEKLIKLGSRNFFLCPNNKNVAVPASTAAAVAHSPAAVTAASSSNPCSNQVERASKTAPPWFKFIAFLF